MLNSAQRSNLTGYPLTYVFTCRKFTILISNVNFINNNNNYKFFLLFGIFTRALQLITFKTTIYFRKDPTFEVNKYVFKWLFSKNIRQHTVQMDSLYFAHMVLRVRTSLTTIRNVPGALWEIQTAEEPIRTCEVSLLYDNVY